MINDSQLKKLLEGHKVALVNIAGENDYSIPTDEDLGYVEPVDEVVRFGVDKMDALYCRSKWAVGEKYKARKNTRTPILQYCPKCKRTYDGREEQHCLKHDPPIKCKSLEYEILSIKLRPFSDVSDADARMYGCLNKEHFTVSFLNYRKKLIKAIREKIEARGFFAFDVLNGVRFTSEGNPVVMGQEIEWNPLLWVREVRMVD